MFPVPGKLEIKNLAVEVGGVRVLHNIHLTVPPGEVHVLVGPNGSGKTSLLATIAGYPQYRVVSGSISYDGTDLLPLGLTERARLGIGLLEQRPPTINGVKLRLLLDYIGGDDPERKRFIEDLIKETDHAHLVDRNIHEDLSGGEIKKAGLLLLLARQPHFAMMDEPDSGVDMDSITLLCQLMNRLLSPEREHPAKRRTGLIITHSDVILGRVSTDKAHVMIDGRVLCGGNPRIIMKKIRESGFDSCVDCLHQGE
ncbi:MAG: ATP-binding cassette domain-containing protein [Spirochaetales bacterium]|nr:ATP-binding cassette domain-containing protein [Spirochaetales bacterium]